jgi:hypothetical protein
VCACVCVCVRGRLRNSPPGVTLGEWGGLGWSVSVGLDPCLQRSWLAYAAYLQDGIHGCHVITIDVCVPLR